MKRAKKATFAVALVAVFAALVGAACSDGGGETTPQPSVGTEPPTNALSIDAAATQVTETPQYATATARSLTQAASAQSEGIFVSGTGRVAVDADLAILALGIEVQDESVAAAHQRATAAMAAVSAAVKGTGVEDRDIQTQRFSIQPIYRWEEVINPNGGQRNQRVLDGYMVTNSVAVRVRDLESVSTVIDEAAKAGGDDVRVGGLQFTVEDATAAQTQARAEATRAAVTHAQEIADAAGVELGKPISLSEIGAPQVQLMVESARSMAAFDSTGSSAPPIESGELEVVVTVNAVFAIP